MAKKARTSAAVLEKVESTPVSDRARTTLVQPDIELDRMERLAAVCELFCKGHTVKEILAKMEERYGEAGRMKREDPYTLVSYAASRGWLQFRAPHHLESAQFIRERYGWLQEVNIVKTAATEDVAQRGAIMLLQLVKEKARRNRKKGKAVHIGFAGGVAMGQLAAAFADVLCRPTPGLPREIVFHAIVAGFSTKDPSTDPNAFFTYFVDRPLMQVTPGFLGLHAPAMVTTADLAKFEQQTEIQEAIAGVKDLDIIVTSGSDWDDPHSLLAKDMREKSPQSYERLRKLGVAGDIMWRPFGPRGPIEERTERRALTLKQLRDLPGFIERGGSVLLMMGPCGGCWHPKGRITKVILDLEVPLITHLVMDSRSGAQLVKESGGYLS